MLLFNSSASLQMSPSPVVTMHCFTSSSSPSFFHHDTLLASSVFQPANVSARHLWLGKNDSDSGYSDGCSALLNF